MATLAIVAVAPLTVTGSQSVAAASTVTTCHAPRMTGLTVTKARERAKVAGCRLRFVGPALRVSDVQTIRTQSVLPGHPGSVVTLLVNPLCSGAALPGPPAGEPIIKSGPTELITSLFLDGGPLSLWSARTCKARVGKSSAGTITITNSVGTVIANNMKLSAGQLLYVNVPAGVYTITGTYSNGLSAGTINVSVTAGEIVRQDLVLDVP
jgi:hypothetical protein